MNKCQIDFFNVQKYKNVSENNSGMREKGGVVVINGEKG